MKGKLKIVGIVVGALFLIGMIAIAIIYREPKVAVLSYHNIAKKEEIKKDDPWCVTLECFEKEMKYLHDAGYKTLTMQEFYEWKTGKREVPFRSVLITFDDGLLSNAEYAMPILKKYGFNATIFCIGKEVEKSTAEKWNGDCSLYMKKSKIEEYKKEYPNIEFYSHSYNMHYENAVNSLTKEQMREGIKKYEELFGKKDVIAYPFGKYNDKVIEVLKEKGYKMGFTLADNKKATRGESNWTINRINVSYDKPLYKFALRLLLPY